MDYESKLKRLDRLNGILIRTDKNSVVYPQLLEDIIHLREELLLNEKEFNDKRDKEENRDKEEDLMSPILEKEQVMNKYDTTEQIETNMDSHEDMLDQNDYSDNEIDDEEYLGNVHNFEEMNRNMDMDNEEYQQDFILSNLPTEYLEKVNQRLLISLCNYFREISYLYLAELCIDTDNNEEEIYKILLE